MNGISQFELNLNEEGYIFISKDRKKKLKKALIPAIILLVQKTVIHLFPVLALVRPIISSIEKFG